MENVPALQKSVDKLGSDVKSLESQVNTLFDVDADSLSPMEQAEYYAALTYSLDSIIFTYLKTIGADPKNHPITQELQRVKGLMMQIKKARGEKPESNSRIDKDAAARFIKHAIGSQAPPDDVKKPDPEALLRKYAGNK